jgi:hypothetical protein
MVKVSTMTKMDQSMMEVGMKIRSVVSVRCYFKTVPFMMDSGNPIRCTEREFSSPPTVTDTKVTSLTG